MQSKPENERYKEQYFDCFWEISINRGGRPIHWQPGVVRGGRVWRSEYWSWMSPFYFTAQAPPSQQFVSATFLWPFRAIYIVWVGSRAPKVQFKYLKVIWHYATLTEMLKSTKSTERSQKWESLIAINIIKTFQLQNIKEFVSFLTNWIKKMVQISTA